MNNLANLEQLKMAEMSLDDRVDICDIHINMNAPTIVRAKQYIEQVKNPYKFRCGDLAVNVCFNEDGKTLENALISYLIMLKNS